jgi:MFS family permease
LAAAATVAITAYLITRYVGVLHFGKIYGIVSSGMGIAAGVGPVLGGWIYDQTGTYAVLLYMGLAVSVVATLLVTRLGDYPDFQKSV